MVVYDESNRAYWVNRKTDTHTELLCIATADSIRISNQYFNDVFK